MAGDDRLRELDQLAIRSACFVAEHVERGLLVDAVPLHEDPLRPLRHGSAPEGTLEGVVLGAASKDDVDRALHLLGVVFAVCDVGEDPSLGRLVDELSVLHGDDRDHGAARFVDDLIDQLQAIRIGVMDDHQGRWTRATPDASRSGRSTPTSVSARILVARTRSA